MQFVRYTMFVGAASAIAIITNREATLTELSKEVFEVVGEMLKEGRQD